MNTELQMGRPLGQCVRTLVICITSGLPTALLQAVLSPVPSPRAVPLSLGPLP